MDIRSLYDKMEGDRRYHDVLYTLLYDVLFPPIEKSALLPAANRVRVDDIKIRSVDSEFFRDMEEILVETVNIRGTKVTLSIQVWTDEYGGMSYAAGCDAPPYSYCKRTLDSPCIHMLRLGVLLVEAVGEQVALEYIKKWEADLNYRCLLADPGGYIYGGRGGGGGRE